MRLRLILFMFTILFLVLPSAGGAVRYFNRYNFQFLTESSGLPYSFVSDICKDSDGYMWIGTHYGISRYDGYQFLNYGTESQPIQLKNDYVHKICEDDHRRLWIASEGGIDIIDLGDYASVALQLPTSSPLQSLFDENVVTLYKDQKGSMWIATNKDLWCIELGNDGSVADYHHLVEGCTSAVRAIVDLEGDLCAGIDNEVCRIRKEADHRLKAEPLSSSLPPFSEDWRISCLKNDGEWLWIGSNRGLFKYHRRLKTLQRYRYSTHRPGMLSQAFITDIQLTEGGDLIVSTLNGLNVYDRASDTFSFIRQNSDRQDRSINCNAINCLFTEGETIWIGTESGGVNLLSPKRLLAEMLTDETADGAQTLPTVSAIGEDHEGALWIALAERGLMRWRKSAESPERYLFSPNDNTSLSNNTLTGLLIDSDNHLWAYTWGVGINDLDLNKPRNHTFKRYTQDQYPGFDSDFISSACEDVVNHGIWFGSTRGVLFFDKRKEAFIRVAFDQSDNEFEAIHALLIDKKRRLWVGSTQGVFVVDLTSFARSNKRFDYKYLKYKLDNPHSTQLEKINTLLEDREGTIWLGGNGSGLYKLESDKNNHFVFQNYTTRHGLPGNTITGMAEDGDGNLWLTTTGGVSRLHPSTMTFSNYTQADDLPASSSGLLYSKLHDRIYMATASGLMILHPYEEDTLAVDKRPTIASLAVGGTLIYPSSGRYLTTNITHAQRLYLHERENRFTVGFTTQNYGNSSRVRFAYRLKGYEKEWNEMQPGDYTARYTAVPAGSYTLQVRATDERGRWGDATTEMAIVVSPYFYKSGWFYGLLLFVLALAAWLFYRHKMRTYREQRAYLEKKVEQRTLELAVQNRRLEKMAEQVQEITEEKITFFTNITHEFRTPVTLIHGPIEHALKQTNEEEVRTQLEMAERNSRYLLELVNELMDFRKLDTDSVELDKRPTDFRLFIDELLIPFRLFANERRIVIRSFCRLSDAMLLIDPAYMRKVVVNLVSNAIKFTPDGGRIDLFVADIKSRSGGRHLYMNVSDTGHGIEEEEKEKIFDRFYQSKKSMKYPVYGQTGTGIGLFLCRRIVHLHGGEITARNNPRQGASFRLLIPLLTTTSDRVGEERRVAQGESETLLQLPDEKPMKRETVLIVEDNPDMRAYIHTLLRDDYTLFEASNGAEGLEMVGQHAVDLIVSDLMMPVMDGMEMSRRLKENLATSHIPLLLLTVIQSEAQQKRGFEIGIDEYLSKPFDEEMLRLRIRNMLQMRRRYKQLFSTHADLESLPVKSGSRDQLFLSNAARLMKEHYAEADYTLECFVRDMGYSKTLVNKKMQDLTGQSIGQYMKSYRLNMARHLLQSASSDVNVSEIAYAVGFNDPKYFTKCYKALFGKLPSSAIRKGEE